MGWADIRSTARSVVHETFGLAATYLPPGVDPVLVEGLAVRWHTRTVRHGDLDREGYAQVQEDVNRLMIDTAQVADPQRGGIITLTDDGRQYRIDYVLPYDGAFAPCDVVQVP